MTKKSEKLFRKILHLDMDAFYASVEMLDNPGLKGKPVIVGGRVSRGVVSAASYEARKYGIHSAMPIAQAKGLCPAGIFLPVRMARYQEISQQIFTIFLGYTPLVEPISLDEAFLDVTGSETMMGPAEKIAEAIRNEVSNKTGLTVSAGVATSKLVAKIASDFRKPDGLTVVPTGREAEFLAPLPINRLWGVGKSTRDSLSLLGVQTIGDLALLPIKLLESKFGKHGRHMYYAARGIDGRQVTPAREVKSVGQEETFADDIRDRATLRQKLLELSIMVGRRLRRYGLAGRTITLKIKYHDFRQVTRSITLKTATDDDKLIYQKATLLLNKTEAGNKPVRLAGITAGNLTSNLKIGQLSMFHEEGEKSGKRKEVNKALDCIKDKFGIRSIQPATLLKKSD